MSSQPAGPAKDNPNSAEPEQGNDSLPSKLSRELSNWRRRRTTERRESMGVLAGGSTGKSEPARTIKVRGHETLVIRKPRLGAKAPAPADRSERSQ